MTRSPFLRVGILNPTGVVGDGGSFQYLRSLIHALTSFDDMLVTVYYDDPRFRDSREASDRLRLVQLRRDGLAGLVRTASTAAGIRSPVVGRFDVLRAHSLDCLVSAASLVGFHLGIPFVGIIYDVMYRYYPGCGEYPWKERVARDLINKRLGRQANRIVVDSEQGKRDLVRFFAMDPARIRPVPLCPPPHVYDAVAFADRAVAEVKAARRLPERFLFYPAQLWDHKNHRRLFEALARLRSQGLVVPMVMVGGAGKTGQNVLDAIPAMGLSDQVFYHGYVSERELVGLYKLADALVFASFADYTNIPILEAMALGTPVLCSNLFAMPEQLGGAGVLFDPFDVDDMAAAIRRIWQGDDLRRELVARGRKRVAQLSLQAFGDRWREIITEVARCQ